MAAALANWADSVGRILLEDSDDEDSERDEIPFDVCIYFDHPARERMESLTRLAV
jgi:hypothetical protein